MKVMGVLVLNKTRDERAGGRVIISSKGFDIQVGWRLAGALRAPRALAKRVL